MSTAMQSHWRRIVAWVEGHAPELLDHLEPPADRADVAAAERRLSMRLPSALHAFYALQNGTPAFAVFPALEPDQTAFGPLPVDEVEFLEVEDEDEDAGDPEEQFEADPAVRPEFWNPLWIPFAAAGDRGDHLMLDLAPTRAGRPGQVIEWRHDTNERRLVAPSLEAMLKDIADGLVGEKYVYDDDNGGAGGGGLRRSG